MNNKIININNLLNDLYVSVKSNGYPLDDDTLYTFLIKRNVRKGERDYYFNDVFPREKVDDGYFSKWIKRFKKIPNIDVRCDSYWSYFCRFENRKKEDYYKTDDYLKMYIPLDKEHIYEGANMIFDYLSSTDIKHVSKISSKIRFDDVVVRLYNKKDAVKLYNFIQKSPYINEGLIKPNDFAFNSNGISFAWDGMLSYNDIVSKLITDYINESVRNGNRVSADLFYDFIRKYVTDEKRVLSLIREYISKGNYNGYFSDVYKVIDLICLSIRSNDMNDFYKFYDYASKGGEISVFEQFEDKEKLFKELIVTMMCKYPINKKHNSGFDLINAYVNGYDGTITRDNNLRFRVLNNLSGDDIQNIVNSSGVLGDDFSDRLRHYINIVIFNDVIKSLELFEAKTIIQRIDTYIDSGDLRYITRQNGARRLMSNLNKSDINKIFIDFGVNDINEYISLYMNNKKGRRK